MTCPTCGSPCTGHTPTHDGDTGYLTALRWSREVPTVEGLYLYRDVSDAKANACRHWRVFYRELEFEIGEGPFEYLGPLPDRHTTRRRG